MGKKKHGGRPPIEGAAKSESVEVRLSSAEKEAFQEAAGLSGLSLSSWIRERLRRVARAELEDADRPVAFLEDAKKSPGKGAGRRASGPTPGEG